MKAVCNAAKICIQTSVVRTEQRATSSNDSAGDEEILEAIFETALILLHTEIPPRQAGLLAFWGLEAVTDISV